ncbi:MAG: GFA family protein [Hyphomicrobium zavarzinii]|uniref:GFA family protein n=1 Tax=Hyphomicrobium zavarzinii TaxID=48292 RepID=UPI001A43BCCE|nr:GFA family protein [Hyphomicrobium zavarzinii]MBL8844578.1 GFA family protein [Hyphomicrobium zavarzinii]
MASAGHTVKGHCLCGAVAFSADVAKLEVDACHCSMCRRWAGGPFIALSCDGELRITGKDHLATYRSSEWGERGFCQTCGTSLFWHLVGTDHYALSANTLDDQSGLVLTSQIFIDEKPGFYEFANDTPKLTGVEVVAAFEASKGGES